MLYRKKYLLSSILDWHIMLIKIEKEREREKEGERKNHYKAASPK